MSTGDSTLMLLLSLNLLLLVFFMLLNSMATYGKRHADEVMKQVREGYNLPAQGAWRGGVLSAPEVPVTGWRNGMVSRLQGIAMNRIDLKVLPQEGNAGKVEIVMPLAAVFDANGKLVKPEVLRNIAAAAGSESQVMWQIVGPWERAAKLAPYVGALTMAMGSGQMIAGAEPRLKIVVMPGSGTPSAMGLKVQRAGEDAGAEVQGVEEKGSASE